MRPLRREWRAVLEAGIWLTRSARRRGVGRAALATTVARAGAGARAVRAETTRGNAAARALLRRLGFDCAVAGERVVAVLTVGAPKRQEPQAD